MSALTLAALIVVGYLPTLILVMRDRAPKHAH
jgi:hypothetical protein